MQYHLQHNNLIITLDEPFDAAQTLDCGQAFRWKETDDGCFEGVAYGQYLKLKASESELIFFDTTTEQFETIWKDYFDFGRSYSQLKALFCADPILKKAVFFAPGLRVLRQEPWEALCTFILSQNNNIKRIKGLVDRLCIGFGAPIGNGRFAFPTPQAIAACSLEDLTPVRAGFRAKYILDAAKKVTCGEVSLDEVNTLPLEEARNILTRIYGVGKKVADCALLYGFGRVDCCPVDVWINRVQTVLYPQGYPDNVIPFLGLAQQFLFHFVRHCPEILQGAL